MKTLEEILKIPKLLNKKISFELNKEKKYLFVGCGSSYNIGLTVSEVMKKNGYSANVKTGGNIVLFDNENYDEAILITRTGTSTETVNSAKNLKKKNIHTIGITCGKDTDIVKNTDESFVFDFANEESVVMTGSFVYILNFLLNGIKEFDLSEDSKKVLDESIKKIDKLNLKNYDHFVFLGFNENYGISKEGALKLQEMALARCEFHEPLEYRHGPKSTLTNKTLVIFNTTGTEMEKSLEEELIKMGARVLTIGEKKEINIKNLSGFETPLRIIPIQYLGYKLAILKGLNPDNPKNLSKSVIL
ncbi:glutamine--fructose-6-phosphate aminotransferase [Tepiditoga spiralis]|uniref:Glutamine--fructose-6-phosphate aminotransferase n=1 Tax=Tepiditoga spiralis TaxID=2108365 RepID=A0A7G1GBC1_9BACT|nr:SIS domain-containing protein [Tepiditoga spiralis]BBE31672.1 glutamine--fructose-6-phosphate aminotransferase [Tepiditoga spiralis]